MDLYPQLSGFLKEIAGDLCRYLEHTLPKISANRDDIYRDLDTMERFALVIGSRKELIHEIRDLKEGVFSPPPPPAPKRPGNGRITRSEAIARMNRIYGTAGFRKNNTRFSNINNARPDVWWFNVPISWLESESDIRLLLYDYGSDELHYLRVPPAYLRSSMSLGHIGSMNNKANLILSTDSYRKFRNVVPIHPGVEFRQFVQNQPEGKDLISRIRS
jgi:hypothetical protein